MRIDWHISPEDVAKVEAFCSEHRYCAFVKMRTVNNLRDNKPPVGKEPFWDRMAGCLLTSQQRSGPDSPVCNFIRTKPFPLEYTVCVLCWSS